MFRLIVPAEFGDAVAAVLNTGDNADYISKIPAFNPANFDSCKPEYALSVLISL